MAEIMPLRMSSNQAMGTNLRQSDDNTPDKMLDQKLFKDIMSRHPTGITIITTSFQGKLFGFTANSFTSVSLEPPSVLFCINKTSGSYKAFIKSKEFAINFLSTDQKDLSSLFATKKLDKFENVKFSLWNESIPLISESCGYMILKRSRVIHHGDHSIIIGIAQNGAISSENSQPLGYFNRQYSTMSQI